MWKQCNLWASHNVVCTGNFTMWMYNMEHLVGRSPLKITILSQSHVSYIFAEYVESLYWQGQHRNKNETCELLGPKYRLHPIFWLENMKTICRTHYTLQITATCFKFLSSISIIYAHLFGCVRSSVRYNQCSWCNYNCQPSLRHSNPWSHWAGTYDATYLMQSVQSVQLRHSSQLSQPVQFWQ